jgi:hypothetical protein
MMKKDDVKFYQDGQMTPGYRALWVVISLTFAFAALHPSVVVPGLNGLFKVLMLVLSIQLAWELTTDRPLLGIKLLSNNQNNKDDK